MQQFKKKYTFSSQTADIKIIFISDIHESLGMIQRFVQNAARQKPDFLFILGDFVSYKVTHLEHHDVINDTHNTIREFTTKVQQSLNIPIFYILGNHEYYKAAYESDTILLVDNQKEIIINDKYQLIGSSGATTALNFNKKEYWPLKGYPFESMDQIKALATDKQFYQNQNKYCLSFLDFREKLISYEQLQQQFNQITHYNANIQQYRLLTDQISPSNYKQLILSHQGPIKSLTSFYYQPLQYAATGSEQLQQYIEDYYNQIVAFVHGHTHYSMEYTDFNKILAGAIFYKGLYGVLTIKENDQLEYTLMRFE